MKQSIISCAGLIIILLVTTHSRLSAAKTPFEFPDAIEYDIYEQGKLISTCTYTCEKAAQGKDFFVLTMECTRPITANNADRFTTTISGKDFSVLFSNGARGHDCIFNVEISEIKGENKFIMKYSGGKDLDKKQREISSPHPVIDFLSFFIVGSKRVSDGDFKKDQSFNLLEGTQIKAVDMKYLGEDKELFHGMPLDVEVLALVHGNDKIYSLKVFKGYDGYIYPLHAVFSDKQHTLEMKATKVQKPQESQFSKRILYLSTLSFLDAAKGSIKNPSGTAKLITNVFIEELYSQVTSIEAARGFGVIKNLAGHTIPDEDGNVQKLIDIIFSLASKKERMDKIIREFMIPYHVDIVVTGQYTDYPNKSTFSLRPVLVFKSHREIVTRNFLLDKKELICWDVNKNEVFCWDAPRQIEKKVREFLSRYPGAVSVKTVPPSTPPQVKTLRKKSPSTSATQQKQQKYPTQPVQPPITIKPTALQKPMPLTVEDVYRMVIDNKFYCNRRYDQNHHSKVIDKLRNEKPMGLAISGGKTSDGKIRVCFVLESDWEVTTKTLPKGGIKTKSIPQKGASYSIALYWTTSELKNKIYNYHEARELVRELNDKNHLGYSDWRIPTMAEIFLVLDEPHSTGNFFPFDNNFKSLKTNLRLWTSTPVEKREGEIHGGCTADAYFIFDNTHDGDFHSITFAIGCSDEQAHVLLVRSDRPAILPVPPTASSTAVQPATTHRTKPRTKPSLPKTTTTTTQKPVKRIPKFQQPSLAVTYFSFMDFASQSSLESTDIGKLINEAIRHGIHRAEQSTGYLFTNRSVHTYIDTADYVNKLGNILFNPGLTKREKINRIIDRLMAPNHVDIIVTGLYIRTLNSSTITLRPMVIVKSSRKILSVNIEFKQEELIDSSSSPYTHRQQLKKAAVDKIARAVKSLLEQV